MKLFAIPAAMVLAASAWALDPAMLNLVPGSATALVGVDMARVQASPLGQYLLEQAAGRNKDLDKLVQATGFDPRRDLQEVLIAASGPNAANQGLIIARGAFDQNRLLNLARVAGLASSNYKGVTIVNTERGSQQAGAAFVAGYLVAGNRAEVEGVIDRVDARTPGTDLTSRAMIASTKFDAWFVSNGADAWTGALPGNGPAGSAPIRGIKSVAGGAQFGSQVDLGLEAEAATVQDATSIADVIRLAALFGQGNGKNPVLGNVLNTLMVAAEGTTVRASVTMSQADFEKLLPRTNRVRRVARR